ncbi:MAG TPA: phosphonate metabolism transcriptional regulator PhnF [Firmicutes bacterium]|jgi:GntR family transcriptional regulator|nr:phosphonate metabolism transcriptional regulator PhnF [Bacillota bacterium]
MIMQLNRDLSTPLYHQIRDLLLEEIQNGNLSPGERIPSEADLGNKYKVSRITVKQAIQSLVQEGLLYRQQGRGTFVARPKVSHSLNTLTSFSQQMLDRGMTPSTKLIEAEIVTARGRVQEALAISDGTLVTKLKRLRLADQEIMGIQTAYIPVSLCPGLIEIIGDNISLYCLFKEKYNLRLARAIENYTAVLLEPYEARLLDQKEGRPALAADRIAYLADNRALEYVISILRADRYTLSVELHGESGVGN